jgi:hypothetical protein
MMTNLIVTALVGVFVVIAVLGHVLVVTALLSKSNGAKRAPEPKHDQPDGRDLSTARR